MSDALINGLAGAGCGIIAQLITYPLQTVNTREKTERDVKKEKRRPGAIELMCQVLKQEGWERLYGGLTSSFVGSAATQEQSHGHAALDHKRKGIGNGSVGMFSTPVAAALAGCENVLLTNPIWVVDTHMQTCTKISKKSQPGC